MVVVHGVVVRVVWVPGGMGTGDGADSGGYPWYGSGHGPGCGFACICRVWQCLAVVLPVFAVFGSVLPCLAVFFGCFAVFGSVLAVLAVFGCTGPVIGCTGPGWWAWQSPWWAWQSPWWGLAESLVGPGLGLVLGGSRGQWNRCHRVSGFASWTKPQNIQK